MTLPDRREGVWEEIDAIKSLIDGIGPGGGAKSFAIYGGGWGGVHTVTGSEDVPLDTVFSESAPLRDYQLANSELVINSPGLYHLLWRQGHNGTSPSAQMSRVQGNWSFADLGVATKLDMSLWSDLAGQFEMSFEGVLPANSTIHPVFACTDGLLATNGSLYVSYFGPVS